MTMPVYNKNMPMLKVWVVTGKVVDYATRVPMPDVDVKIYEYGQLKYQGKTDTSGVFSINVYGSNPYTLSASKTGYKTGEAIVNPLMSESMTISIKKEA